MTKVHGSVDAADREVALGIMSLSDRIRAIMADTIVGQETLLDVLVASVFCQGHVLLEGVPGIAKTLSAKLLSRTLDVEMKRIQFTPDLMPSDVLGTTVFNPRDVEFNFRPGPVFTNFLLIDEINRAPAKTQSALFEVMEERAVSIDGRTHTLGFPFMVIATQNPIDQEGTYRLPEAQLDRFLFKVQLNHPNLAEEITILDRYAKRMGTVDFDAIQPVANSQQLRSAQLYLHQVRAESEIVRYIAELVYATRTDPGITLGASPRASIGLLQAAKARAMMSGRDFVIPDDVKSMALHVISHRIVLSPERELEGFSESDVVQQIVNRIAVPR